MNIELLPQKYAGDSKFNGRLVMTKGFKSEFGVITPILALQTLLKILHERVKKSGADYLQVCKYNGTTYWVIDDNSVVTFLLPEEY